MSVVLVVNSGSSSFKYQLLDMEHERVLASGWSSASARGSASPPTP